ncbi:Abi family protein [Deinococcus marmoris]|uniref:Abi family protein n=1 Tax=Deinococcus marmoris TaxID=249408 RepID=UPI0039EF0E6F
MFTLPSEYFNHGEFLAKALSDFHAMPDLFVGHYRERYDQSELPPIWMVAETMTLGS